MNNQVNTPTLRRAFLLFSTILALTGAVTPIQIPSDAEISSAVSFKLFADPYFSPKEMRVQTDRGAVTLTGLTSDLRSKDRAARIAEQIRGVRSVINRLSVKPTSISEQKLQQQVKDALAMDPTTAAYDVSPKVINGIVELNGTVHSWAEKQLASWVINGIPGVGEVNNQLAIRYPITGSDAQIAADIQGRLRQDPWIANYSLGVAVVQGNVSLSGVVGSALAKRNAFADAWVYGVKNVDVAALTVDPALANPATRQSEPLFSLTDQDIKSNVLSAFSWDPRVNRYNPNVQVDKGVATLSGSVGNIAAKAAAEQDAYNTVGVLSVTNRLKVRPVFRPDRAIEASLKKSFDWNLPSNVRSEIKARVSSGVVTLTGRVRSPYEEWQARDAAMRVRGVVAVNNQLGIATRREPFLDQDTRERIEQAIHWDPLINPSQSRIQVRVENGKARLAGNVENWDEHAAATRDAFNAGATRVENSLRVRKAPNERKTYVYNSYPEATTNASAIG